MEKAFQVYRSSAGSGKTFTLVKEYLKLCLKTEDAFAFRRILAITFTNKAANEMKSRVLKALKEIADPNADLQDPLIQLLLEELNIDAASLQRRSERTLRQLIHHYADFSISTIDKFTYRLIRSFAKDLDLPSRFEVELDTELLLRQAIDLLLSKVGQEKAISNVLLDYARSKAAEESHWDIERELFDFSYELLGEESGPYLDLLKSLELPDFYRIRKALKAENQKLEQEVQELGKQALALIAQHQIPLQAFAGGASRGIGKYFQYLKDFKTANLTPTDSLKKAVDNDKWVASKVSPSDAAAIEGIQEQLGAYYRQAVDLMEKELAAYLGRSYVLQRLFALALVHEIERVLDELMEEDRSLHISEFNKRINQVVLQQPVPFIYERIGERYQHYMIDEFQDTSVLQWQNLLPLIENALATGKQNLIVGDAKQAIYRFRGGDVEQFVQLPFAANEHTDTLTLERQEALSHHYQESILGTNFRSYDQIIQFNNRFFEAAAQLLPESVQAIFKQHQQQATDKKGGYVEVVFQPQKQEIELALAAITEKVEACLSDGFLPKDIAIICRWNRQAVQVAEHLVDQGIPIISSESLLLERSPEIRFLLQLMAHLQQPTVVEHQKHILTFWAHHTGKSAALDQWFRRWLIDQPFADFFRSHAFSFSPYRLLSLPIYELVEECIRLFRLDQQYDSYLQSFLEAVWEYANQGQGGLAGFFEWWEEKGRKRSIQISESENAVRIMTIHKSKGLEFPVVIYPFAQQRIGSSGFGSEPLWVKTDLHPDLPVALVPYKKELEQSVFKAVFEKETERKWMDLINETYVAFTRPRERLYIFSEQPSANNKLNSLGALLWQALENMEGFDLEQAIYRQGELSNYSKSNNDTAETTSRSFVSEPWENRLLISLEAPLYWEANDANSAKQKGNILHRLLASIDRAEEIDNVLDQQLHLGLFTKEEQADYRELLNRIMNSPQLAPYFDPNKTIKKEATIMDAEGQVFRPDRVIIEGQKATVLDYKSGKKDAEHLKQLKNYQRLLEEMGYHPVEGYLLYLKGLELVPLTAQSTDQGQISLFD